MAATNKTIWGRLGKICWYGFLFLSIFGMAGMAFIAIKDAGKRAPLPNLALERFLAKAGIEPPLAVVITRNRNEIFNYRQPTDGGPQTFPMGRLTDLLTAMTIIILCDQGRIGLADPLGNFIEGLPAESGAISIRQLLDHTSGLTPEHPLIPAFPPGERAVLAEANYVLLTKIIEKVTGAPVPEYFESAILSPLEMTSTRLEAGVWLTTAADLGRYEQALNSNRLVRLKTLTDAMRLPRQKLADGAYFSAGWQVRNYKGLRLESAGSGSARICRVPNKNFAAVILAGPLVPDQEIDQLVRVIMDLYLGREMPEPRRPD